MWKLPKLYIWQRILLYLITIVFAALAIIDVVIKTFNQLVGIAIYVGAAVTLAASCYYFVTNISHSDGDSILPGIEANPFINRIRKDYYYRTVTFAIPGLVVSILFGVFNGIIGIISLSPWFGTLAAYYLLLSIMRTATLKYQKKVLRLDDTGSTVHREIHLCKSCGIMLFLMLFVLIGAVVLLITCEDGKTYPGLTIYAVAAYAFYKITMSIINVVKARRMKTIVLMIIRDIGFVDSCVAILSLQTAMFAAFGDGDTFMIKMMNGATGIVVCCAIFATSLYEFRLASKMQKELEQNADKGQNSK